MDDGVTKRRRGSEAGSLRPPLGFRPLSGRRHPEGLLTLLQGHGCTAHEALRAFADILAAHDGAAELDRASHDSLQALEADLGADRNPAASVHDTAERTTTQTKDAT